MIFDSLLVYVRWVVYGRDATKHGLCPPDEVDQRADEQINELSNVELLRYVDDWLEMRKVEAKDDDDEI